MSKPSLDTPRERPSYRELYLIVQGVPKMELAKQIWDLRHDLERALANHSADLNTLPSERGPNEIGKEIAAKLSPAQSAVEQGKPMGWYDHFNDCLYKDETDAKDAERGGNKVTPLYAQSARKQCNYPACGLDDGKPCFSYCPVDSGSGHG